MNAKSRFLSRRFVLTGLLGAVVTIVAIAVLRGPHYPVLTAAAFDTAERRWQSANIRDYEVEVTVTGRQPAIYRVVVRGGEVQSATRNGKPLNQFRTMGTWSVPGMFDTIAIDLENVERVATGRADPGTPRLDLRGTFDERFGYPLRYLRIEHVRQGANPEITWEVTRFVCEFTEDRGILNRDKGSH